MIKPYLPIEETSCPYCYRPINCTTPVSDEKKPLVGDLVICGYCGEFLAFGRDLALIKPDGQTLRKIAAHHKIRQVQAAIKRKLGEWQ